MSTSSTDYAELLDTCTLPSIEDIDETLIVEHRSSQLVLLRKLRNAHAPLLRLPHELISAILLFCCPWFLDDWEEVNGEPLSRFVRLTQVCSYVHSVALSTPHLWAFVSTKWETMMPVMFQRAGQLPLAVHLEPRDEELWSEDNRTQEQVALLGVLYDMTRIRSLHLAGSDYESEPDWQAEAKEQIRRLLRSPLPLLEKLSLHAVLDFDETTLGPAPRLQTLRLSGIWVEVNLIGCRYLRHLRVLELREVGEVSVLAIFHVIRTAVYLKELHLEVWISRDDLCLQVPVQPIEASALERLHLAMPSYILVLLMRNLVLPALVKLRLICDTRTEDLEGVRILQSGVITNFFDRWSGFLGSSSFIHRLWKPDERTSTLSITAHGSHPDSVGTPSCSIEIRQPRPSHDIAQDIIKISVAIFARILSETVRLSTEPLAHIPLQGWRDLFVPGNSQALRKLDVAGESGAELVLALKGMGSPVHGADASHTCILPHLTKLTLRSVDFGVVISGLPLVAHLQQSLQMRNEVPHVARLSELVLVGCDGVCEAECEQIEALGTVIVISPEDD
jgi:hypothetical protein